MGPQSENKMFLLEFLGEGGHFGTTNTPSEELSSQIFPFHNDVAVVKSK
jgi:hypothetical protein